MLNAPNDEATAQRDKAIQQFIEDSRFAKVVKTSHGSAILIDGHVIEVISSEQAFVVDAIVRALRSSRVDCGTAVNTMSQAEATS
ncbi:hypothetical protein [Neorhizobium sp. NCHU2750]|uniref:hypothetical protein n=1 Tax=Neorhizobium sp. NCHU2750 TaxID=1825976 RepID=UPI000E76E8FC|nr:hypothetical protein NCHU2750_28230 [Neorhizobium sp. NCHU2750]